jgi:hypothetical protein
MSRKCILSGVFDSDMGYSIDPPKHLKYWEENPNLVYEATPYSSDEANTPPGNHIHPFWNVKQPGGYIYPFPEPWLIFLEEK